MKITFKNGEKRKYHVKTHSTGRLLCISPVAKSVNPRELLVYIVLERLGFGCETHFLQRNLQDVYIADAGHGGSFNVFKKAIGILGVGNEAYGQSLWGLYK